MKVAAIVSLIAGVAAVAGLFMIANPPRIWELIRSVTVWLVALAVLHFGFIYLSTLAWRSMLAGQGVHRPVPELFRMRWIGDAISALTPFGIADGEAWRAYIQAKETPVEGTLAAAVVLVELTARLLSLLLFIVVGLILLAVTGKEHAWVISGAATGVLTLVLVAYVYGQKHGWIDRLAREIGKRSKSRRWRELALDTKEVDRRLDPLYEAHGPFRRTTAWHFAAWVFSALEMMFTLWVLGTPVGFIDGVIFEAIGQAARNVGFFLPAALGAQEGGYFLGAEAIGKSASVGLAVAIIKRLRDIIFGVPALLLWQWRELKKKKQRDRERQMWREEDED